MISLSVSEGNSWSYNPDGGERFEIQFPPLRAAGVADSGGEVVFLESSGAARAVPEPVSWEGPIPPTLKLVKENVGLSCWKATGLVTWKYVGWSAVDLVRFLLAFFGGIGAVTPHCVPWVKVFWWTVLQNFVKGGIPMQGHLDHCHLQWFDLTHFAEVKCVQHWWAVRIVGLVPQVPVLGWPWEQGGGGLSLYILETTLVHSRRVYRCNVPFIFPYLTTLLKGGWVSWAFFF